MAIEKRRPEEKIARVVQSSKIRRLGESVEDNWGEEDVASRYGKRCRRTELCGILRFAVDLRLCKRARVDSVRRCSLPVGDADLNWAIVGNSIGGEKL